ncbi:hypothetical protein HKX48_002661 [Thoreauomyces humboldtii]|nr:hypothetical protein HKX48_002661 [Thoreauomyces humboldtii]
MESFHGAVNSPNDALLLFEACRLNLLKRVQRRLSESERTAYVVSGAVFIWDEEESGIKRWTDGKHWSPSRINGSFLIYREVEPRKTVIPGVSEEKIEYVIKDGGLTKKAISITTSLGRKQHLVSYYLRTDVNRAQLEAPTDMQMFAEVVISTEIYPDFMTDCQASITSSRSSITSLPSNYAPSVASSSQGDYVRPNFVPVPKVKPVKPTRDPSESDLPRPSQDSGKHMSISSLSGYGDDGRSFRSYDSHRSYNNDGYSTRSFDNQSIRSYSSGRDEGWAPPPHLGGYNGSPAPPAHGREPQFGGHYDQQQHGQQSRHQQQGSGGGGGYHGMDTSGGGRDGGGGSPSMHRSSSGNPPPEFQKSQQPYPQHQHHHHHHHQQHHQQQPSSPHRPASVRSLPLGLVESGNGSKRELVLPVPKPSSVHNFPQQMNGSGEGGGGVPGPNGGSGSGGGGSGGSGGGEQRGVGGHAPQAPMFLAHTNWTPDHRSFRGGGSLEGVSRLGLSGSATPPVATSGKVGDAAKQHESSPMSGLGEGPGPMDWEPGEAP